MPAGNEKPGTQNIFCQYKYHETDKKTLQTKIVEYDIFQSEIVDINFQFATNSMLALLMVNLGHIS